MATSAIVRVRGGKYGSGPTTISGVRGFTERVRYSFARGQSDGEFGPTSFTLTGMESSGNVVVEGYDEARTMLAAATGPLVLQYDVAGGTDRKATYDNVRFISIDQVNLQQDPGDGPIVAYAVNWRGVFAAADADIDDHMAAANDT